jgi:hypothetical protein
MPKTGGTVARGYGKDHRKARERFRPSVEAGLATCVRCMVPITPPGGTCPRCGRVVAKGRPGPGQCGWDMGHDDYAEGVHSGTEHACCNRHAGAKRGGRASARARSARVWSRQWLSD